MIDTICSDVHLKVALKFYVYPALEGYIMQQYQEKNNNPACDIYWVLGIGYLDILYVSGILDMPDCLYA